jgi:hypothetical protein
MVDAARGATVTASAPSVMAGVSGQRNHLLQMWWAPTDSEGCSTFHRLLGQAESFVKRSQRWVDRAE